MSLRNIVDKMGGDLFGGGTQANIPAPGHSLRDRSVSLRIGRNGQVVVHAFSMTGVDWREVLDDLRDRRLVDACNRPIAQGGVAGPRIASVDVTGVERVAAARRIWQVGRAVVGTLSERHAALRHIVRSLPGSDVLRHLQETPVSVYRPRSPTMPASLAAISDEAGAFTAVEITYLDPNGSRTRRLRLSRKTVGLAPSSSAVRLDPPGRSMLVAEGVFTSLSASARFDLPGWALLSTRNLRTWRPPANVCFVLIAGDRGKDGEASAEVLAGRLRRRGLRVRIELPPAPHLDWNDADTCRETSARPSRAGLLPA